MKYTTKRSIVYFIRFVAFVCFLLTFWPALEINSSVYIDYSMIFSITWFIMLCWTHGMTTLNLLEKGAKKWLLGVGIGAIAIQLIFWLVVLIILLSNNGKLVIWNGYRVLEVIWAIVGFTYLLLGLTKTIDDHKPEDKTIPYSD